MYKIGGEFEINPFSLKGFPDYMNDQDKFFYSSGRSALVSILNNISKTYSKKVIHIPYYICYSVVKACQTAEYQIRFYEPDKDYLFPLDQLENIGKNEVLLTVNYFGFVNDNKRIRKVREERNDIIIISDQVQSFWTYKKTEADFSFTSLRKHFPVPDGAFVYCKNDMSSLQQNIPSCSVSRNKLLGSFLKYFKAPDELYLHYFKKGEEELDTETTVSKSSLEAQFLFNTTDFEQAIYHRKENCKFVFEFGAANGIDFIFPFDENIIPLSIPVFLKNAVDVRKELMRSNIFLPIHWPLSDFNQHSALAQKMANNSLSLVIDQRYNTEEIEFELNSFLKVIRND